MEWGTQRARVSYWLIQINFLPFLVRQPPISACPHHGFVPPGLPGVECTGWDPVDRASPAPGTPEWNPLQLSQQTCEAETIASFYSEGKWGPRDSPPWLMKRNGVVRNGCNEWDHESIISSLILCLPATCKICFRLSLTSVASES